MYGIVVNGDVIFNGVDSSDIHKLRNKTVVSTAKKRVKERDKVCQCCGDGEGQLEVHHIFPVNKYGLLVADEDNLITLCQTCHRKYHDKVGKNVNPLSLIKFMKR